jgi:hypothetical protein
MVPHYFCKKNIKNKNMNTTIQTAQVNISENISISRVQAQARTQSKTVSEFWETAEFNRFGIVPLALLLVVCIGALAGAVALQSGPVKLTLVTVPAAVVEALIIAVLPVRTIVIASAISMLVSLLVIIF